ncbi:MAG: hypothetical protein NTW07_09960 [candidate division Zixibacteria bacterium]|nr:hypothetical protein [candidate division Zixibacteria bacterium]
MKQKHNITAIVALTVTLLTTAIQAAGSGAGAVRLGYTYLDEDGSRAVNQETHNSYEGLGVSLNQWHYNWDSGMRLKADLNNVTLNNRNLRFSIGKPGSFGLSVTNSQYRRIYSDSGNDYTRRRATNVQANYQPTQHVKLNAGYGRMDKHGKDFFVLPAISDTVSRSTDWSQNTYNLGAQFGDGIRLFRADYRRFDFTDNTPLAANRTADLINLQASSALPRYDWAVVSGGLNYRKDKAAKTETELKTSQYWTGAKLNFTSTLYTDYRLIYAINDRSTPARTIDNYSNSIVLGKSWSLWGGARVGYENRVGDDFVSRTKSDGLLVSAWLKPAEKWYFNCGVSTHKSDVTDGVTLLGDENRTNHTIVAKFIEPQWGDISARWDGRIRKNDDLTSKVDYDILSGEVNLSRPKLGRLTVSYSHYTGSYTNQSDVTSYEFVEHLLTGHAYPVAYKNFTVDGGGTYYRSQRDQDVEKFSLDLGVSYQFPRSYRVEVRYNVFNFDDFLFLDKYYTANIVEVSLIKDVQF